MLERQTKELSRKKKKTVKLQKIGIKQVVLEYVCHVF